MHQCNDTQVQSDRNPCCVGGRDVFEIQVVGGGLCVSTPTAAAEKQLSSQEKKEHYYHACVMAYLQRVWMQLNSCEEDAA